MGIAAAVLFGFSTKEGLLLGAILSSTVAFFAVLLSTLVQGSTFEALARSLRLTTSEPALPRPLVESGTIRRLGAEVLLINEESVPITRAAVDRWRSGPIGPSPRPRRPIMGRRPILGRRPIFTVWSWNEERDGSVSRPRAIAGWSVIEQLHPP